MKVENWNGYKIRFVEKDGEWWAVAKDVAAALGYRDAEKATRYLPVKYKGTHKVSTTSDKGTPKQGITSEKDNLSKVPLKTRARETQDMVVLNEPGLYRLIMRSHKPEAEAFQDWVYGVLKQLRQASGLEAYQTFHMLDKEFQKNAMATIHDSNPKADQKCYIKANTLADKAVSIQYGLPKMIKKADMPPEMLKDRQKWLTMAVELMTVQEKYHLEFSVSERLYEMVQGEKKVA